MVLQPISPPGIAPAREMLMTIRWVGRVAAPSGIEPRVAKRNAHLSKARMYTTNTRKVTRAYRVAASLPVPVLLLGIYAFSAVEAAPKDGYEPGSYSRTGADTCLKCHDEDNKYPILPFFKTKHAQIADARTPMAKLQCETCHGPIGEHGKMMLHKGEKRAPIINFGPKSILPVTQQNTICLDCHEKIGWQGSMHEANGLACVSCHQVHIARDRVLARTQQPDICFRCHKKQRAQIHRASVHPIRQGQMACSDCHNPHSSFGLKHLAKTMLNETCYTCHAEKRGPFLWAHPPVMENCGYCHMPHGSMHPALLTKRPPQLCQQCHSQAGHPSLKLDGEAITNDLTMRFVLAQSCLNCHSKVHGSNHPSGVKLMR